MTEILREKSTLIDMNTAFQSAIDRAYKFCETFDDAINKWTDNFEKIDKSVQIKELQQFVEISQEELEEKEKLLIFFKKKLKEEIEKKDVDLGSISALIETRDLEIEILRNKIFAQEKFIVQEKLNYRKEFDKIISLFQGFGNEKSSSLLSDSLFEIKGELKKYQLLFSKNGKKKASENDQILRIMERVETECVSLRRLIDVGFTSQLLEVQKQAFLDVAAVGKMIKANYETVDQRKELKEMQKEILNVKTLLENELSQKSVTHFNGFFIDFKLLYKNIEESIRKLIKECKAKDSSIQEFSKNGGIKLKEQLGSFSQSVQQISASFHKIKSKIDKISSSVDGLFQKPLLDFHGLRVEIKLAIDAQEESQHKISEIISFLKKLYEENVLRTKNVEQNVSEIDIKMILRKLNEIRNEFSVD